MDNADADMEALKQTADFLRLTSGLVTGTIAFSFVFLGGTVSTPASARPWIFAAWVVLFISLVLSIVVFMLIPPKFEAKEYSLYDPFLNTFGIAHLGTFVLGFILLAIGVGLLSFTHSENDRDQVKTAQRAVALALQKLPHRPAIISIATVDLIKGTDPVRSEFSTWRIHANVVYPSSVCPKGCHLPAAFDVYVNAATGNVSSVP